MYQCFVYEVQLFLVREFLGLLIFSLWPLSAVRRCCGRKSKLSAHPHKIKTTMYLFQFNIEKLKFALKHEFSFSLSSFMKTTFLSWKRMDFHQNIIFIGKKLIFATNLKYFALLIINNIYWLISKFFHYHPSLFYPWLHNLIKPIASFSPRQSVSFPPSPYHILSHQPYIISDFLISDVCILQHATL